MRSFIKLIFWVGILLSKNVCIGQSGTALFFTTDQVKEFRSLLTTDSSFHHFADELRQHAQECLQSGPWRITDYPSPAASGNPQDYYSEGPYWWPDPNNPDGPYIRRDGQVNPQHFSAHRAAFDQVCEATLTLAAAGYFFEDRASLDHARQILVAWYIDPETRMNPHLEYGQAIRGVTEGRGIGIIDTTPLIDLVQGLYFLELSGFWPAKEQVAMREWLRDYLTWLTTSQKGYDEQYHGNNHSTWWAAQVASLALYLENHETLQTVWQFFNAFLVPHQIAPNGSCPLEEERTRSLSYSVMNADGFAILCRLARYDGQDIWSVRGPQSGSIRTAAAYLAPYLADPWRWKKPQMSPFTPQRRKFLLIAALDLGQWEYARLAQSLPRAKGTLNALLDLEFVVMTQPQMNNFLNR